MTLYYHIIVFYIYNPNQSAMLEVGAHAMDTQHSADGRATGIRVEFEFEFIVSDVVHKLYFIKLTVTVNAV